MLMRLTTFILLMLALHLAAANVLLSDSCSGRCGDGLSSSHSCQCNEHCVRYGDCCIDYSSLCADGGQASCTGRCGDNYSSAHTCQCNTQCNTFGDCCADYTTVCSTSGGGGGGGESGDLTNAELLAIGDDLWAADTHRFAPRELTLASSGQDRLFSYVNEDKLATASYSLFINLLDNYNAINGQVEPPLTAYEQAETDLFLDHILASDVMRIVENLLVAKGMVQSGNMKSTLYDLWFALYGRSSSMSFSDSSGFEHVFVGEKKSSKVNGFHSWIQQYMLEQSGNMRYLGSNAIAEPDLRDNKLEWDGLIKERASMFIGTSPEFEMAVYSLCMIARPGQVCQLNIGGNIVSIQTYDVSHVSGLQVATAFPMVRNS